MNFSSKQLKLHKIDPIPENLEGKYLYLSDNSRKIQEQLISKRKEIESLECKLEHCMKKHDIEVLLSVANKLQKNVKDFESSDAWPSLFIADAHKLFGYAQESLLESVGEWIPRQICNSIATLSDFSRETG